MRAQGLTLGAAAALVPELMILHILRVAEVRRSKMAPNRQESPFYGQRGSHDQIRLSAFADEKGL